MSEVLYTLGFPQLAPADRRMIEDFRKAHDPPYRDVVQAHVTLVFGIEDVDPAAYIAHIRAVTQTANPIDFVCRYAMLGSDHASDDAYVFLVPDEGFSAISLLHDRLYTGLLAPKLRLDLPFIPHITLGTLADRQATKALCDGLNEKGVHVAGRLTDLSVCALRDGKIAKLEKLGLLG